MKFRPIPDEPSDSDLECNCLAKIFNIFSVQTMTYICVLHVCVCMEDGVQKANDNFKKENKKKSIVNNNSVGCYCFKVPKFPIKYKRKWNNIQALNVIPEVLFARSFNFTLNNDIFLLLLLLLFLLFVFF